MKANIIVIGILLFSIFSGTVSCKDDDEKVVPVPQISAVVDGYNAADQTVSVTGNMINITIPPYDAKSKPTDLTHLKIAISVKNGFLKDYDNTIYHNFSQPLTVAISDYMYNVVDYTVKVQVSTAAAFEMKGILIDGITLAGADVVISGNTIHAKVPTLKDNYSATAYTSLPVFYVFENGMTNGFENGTAMNYSGSAGVDVTFKDYNGGNLTYHVTIEPVYADKGPQIDPILTFNAISLNWQKVTTETLPSGVELYAVNDLKPGSSTDKANGYYAKLDLSTASQSQLAVGYTTGAAQNIKKFYTDAVNPKPAIITNGGFFGGSTSYSLVVDNSVIKFSNIAALNRDLNGVSTSYSPTRSAFGIMSDGTAEVAWIYNSGGKTYAFDTPVRNAMNYSPMPNPMDNAFASIRKEWKPVVAIGGAPVLIKNDQIVLTQTAEICDQFQGNRARTAIGVTADNHLILLVLDETPAPVKGWSLTDLAMIMKTLGCKHALNLDGGGSTAMVVNGVIKNKPSDTASEGDSRAIPTTVFIKQK